MVELSTKLTNFIPNLPFDKGGFFYCKWYKTCPRKYCDKKISGIPQENKCLILERGIYYHFILNSDCRDK